MLICIPLAGCMVVQVGATNPIPGLSTVAVAPFMNLSQEPTVDGRRFALAYYAELQKIPGFQVVPVGVVEQVMVDFELEMNNPDDVLKLARILEVDAVVVGAVTDYDAYYPPRIGMQVAWYSPDPWRFYPGVQVDPYSRSRFRQLIDEEERQQERYRRFQREQAKELENAGRRAIREQKKAMQHDGPGWHDSKLMREIRGQSPDVPPRFRSNAEVGLSSRDLDAPEAYSGWIETGASPSSATQPRIARYWPLKSAPSVWEPVQSSQPPKILEKNSLRSNYSTAELPLQPVSTVEPAVVPNPQELPPPLPGPELPKPDDDGKQMPPEAPLYMGPPELQVPGVFSTPPVKVDAGKPIMSYTRMFDGADADLIAALRDYVEIGGDLRSGSWEAYLYRSEDFIRFTTHLMVVEMLTLHGGQGKRRLILKLRKHR